MQSFVCALLLATAIPLAAQPVAAIRNKIAAGDLYSAESLLEVHRATNGEDGAYLQGLGWLARGALMNGHPKEAALYAAEARRMALDVIGKQGFANAADATGALGTALEVEAQLLNQQGKRRQATNLLEDQLRLHATAPPAFRARIYKRLNLFTLEGRVAPPVKSEHVQGPSFPALDTLRGKPIVLFFWAEWCGDCRAQSVALSAAVKEFAPLGVEFLSVTRFYKEGGEAELARVRKQWIEQYAGLEDVPVAISSQAMERYGISSTPTFVMVDTNGKVARYLPYRLTSERLRDEIQRAMRAGR